MKKLYFLLFTFLITSLSFGQTTVATQDFEGAGTWAHTPTPAVYNVSGDVWDVVSTLSSINPQSGANFWGMQDLENPNGGGAFDHTLAFPNASVSGQVDILVTFYYYTIGFDSTDTLRVEFFYDDVSQGEEALSKDTAGAWALNSKVVPNGTADVRFTILARQNGGSDYAGIDNILLQYDANVAPGLSITAPTEAETVNSGINGFDTTLDIQNFTVSGDAGGGVSDNTGDGFIKYSLDAGSSISKFDAGATNFVGLADGAHTLYFELVDNAGAALGTPVNATVNFTINGIIQALPFHEPFDYVVSETLDAQANWTNNFSGDDILIVDDNLSYTNLPAPTGKAISYAGSGADPTVDLVPTTSGQAYASFMLKITDLTAQSLTTDEYSIVLRDVSGNYASRIWIDKIDDTNYAVGIGQSANPVFFGSLAAGTSNLIVFNYDFDDDSLNLWVNPTVGGSAPTQDATYAAVDIPSSIEQLLIRQDTGVPDIVLDELRIGTTWLDVAPTTLGIEDISPNNFKIYPNPTSLGYVNISSRSQTTMKVNVFDILGKQVINSNVIDNKLDVSNLNQGIYIMRLTQNNATITKKLVIK